MTVMIVEDDPLIALDMSLTLEERGVDTFPPAATVEKAFELIDTDDVSFAFLDFNLGDETSVPIADALSERAIPFIYVTGQPEHILDDNKAPKAPILPKPVDMNLAAQFAQ